jgi:hypothetical protein
VEGYLSDSTTSVQLQRLRSYRFQGTGRAQNRIWRFQSTQELLAKQVSTYDESEFCRLLLEISLLDSAYRRSNTSNDDTLANSAKRYRVDIDKLQKVIANELAAKRGKRTEDQITAKCSQDCINHSGN